MKVFVQLSFLAMIFYFGQVVEGARFLPTMSKGELMEIVDCIGHSKTQSLCDGFEHCMLDKDAPQVLAAYAKCDKRYNPSGNKKCDANTDLFPSNDIPSKIYDCVAQNTSELTEEENQQMRAFEDCVRDLNTKCQSLSKN